MQQTNTNLAKHAWGITAIAVLLALFWGIVSINPDPQNLSPPEPGEAERIKYYEDMHRAAPGVNWKAIDEETRRVKAMDKFRKIQEAGYTRTALESQMDTVADGQLVGRWREIGSANLSGRIHLAEYDVSDGAVYLASAGGNIWKGDHDDWKGWDEV